MAVNGRTTDANGDAILISLQEPYLNVVEVLGYTDVTKGESTGTYYNKQFRWGTDGVTYSDYTTLTNANLEALLLNPNKPFWIQYRYEQVGDGTLEFESIALELVTDGGVICRVPQVECGAEGCIGVPNLVVDCCGDTWNPYDLSRASSMYNQLSAITSNMFGFCVDYFKTKAQALYKAGFQMNTHCIGDSAARLIMKIYGEVLQKNNDKRWRIEHAQLVHHADVNLFKQFNIIPSVQPTHATSDMRWAVLRVGIQRLKYGYAYEKLRNQNGMIALGTDFPIENISPIETFYAAVARKDVNGTPKNGFQIEDALSRLNAMKGMTIWAATANFEEKEKGSLEIGKLADFVILNRDIMSCEEDDILQTQVIRTYIDGNTVFKN